MFILFALLTKLAARTYRKSVLAWRHAFSFGAIAILAGATGAMLNRSTGFNLGPILAVLIGLAIQLTLGGWYLGPRMHHSSGEPIAFKGGLIVASIAYGFIIALGIVAALISPAFSRGAV